MKQRIFHPIGQGAFYTEKHDNLNIVFDCGNWKKSKRASKTVSQSFKKTDVIKILFISHFDFDHVSLIPTLKNSVANIEIVVMPLLHENEKFFLINLYRILGFDFIELIRNPASFFGEKTKIIYVNSSSPQKILENQENMDISTLETNTEIKSGTKLLLSTELPDWVFIPYNFEYPQRSTDLENKLRNAGFNVSKLKNDAKYTLDEIVSDINLTVKKGGKLFQQIYDSLKGKINQNSMILYSGPTEDSYKTYKKRIFIPYKPHFFKRSFTNDVGCVYSGDSDFNVISIDSIYRNFWTFIGTVQIPHHGDLKCFESSFLNKTLFCPFSYGTNNNYGHPSTVVTAEIHNRGSLPIYVNENLNTAYIEAF
ncbi:MBL fold metallo-hydrolase [uncultured Tenacibaculum sp.]|uniref:MBL fold metallo-hydrolase n=1 Tax=uncultured Tenacibaculum sp. TaxID=174713 RepID=UPI00260ADCAE|nr:MBL fold metallo-hydrolase [uncultured Tenacibaculum sp.]